MSDAAPPGWYPDPAGSGGRRWWDGTRWSDLVASAGTGGGPPPVAAGAGGRGTASYAIAALVLGLTALGPLAIGFGIAALRQIRRSGGRLGGRGMAVAGLVLGGVWTLALAGLVVLGALGHLDAVNEDDFDGEPRRVARVVDRIEDAYNDDDEPLLCRELFTPGFAAAYAYEGRPCEAGLDEELEAGEDQLAYYDFDVRWIRIAGDEAVVGLEGDERWTLRRVGGRWRLDDDGRAAPSGTDLS